MSEPLRLGVDPRPAEEGFKRYEQAADGAVAATNRASNAIDSYERAMADRLSSSDIAAAEERYAAAFGEVAEQTEKTATSSTKATAGLSRLNFSLASVARQAAGVHPVVGQLANTVSSFALTAVQTTAVLAGLAAIAAAVRLIGREASEARQRVQEAEEVLDRLAPDTSIGESIAEIQRRYDRNIIAFRQLGDEDWISGALRRGATREGLDRDRAALFDSLMADAERLSRGQTQVDEQDLSERTERARAIQESIGFAMAEVDRQITQQILEERKNAELQYQQEITGAIAAGAAANLTAPSRFGRLTGGAFDKSAEEQQLIITERRIQAERELKDLERDRVRANIALVNSLQNVGRAYGGVVDQVLALIAASVAMERMPMVSRSDQLTAYGSAALAGIGYGASTGNAFLGAAGGGAAGWRMTGTPQGLILGAVGGIVSGLLEHGQRAKAAQRIWENALEDFSLMFDDLSPVEQNIAALNRSFQQLSGGRSIEQVREDIENYRNTIERGRNPTAVKATEELLARDLELVRAYEENAAQARELAEAERDLHESRTAALNDPSGLRLSLLRWRASGTIGDDPSSPGGPLDGGLLPGLSPASSAQTIIQGDVVFEIPGASDPDAVADAVMDRLSVRGLRGGPDPIRVRRR